MTQTPTIDQVVEAYIKYRNEKSALEASVKDQVKAISEKMGKLETWIQAKLDADGATSFATPHGTAYLNTTEFANVADWDAVLAFIKEHDAYDLLERRVNKTAVRSYIDGENAVPPGVSFGSKVSVGIRNPTKKAGS